MSTQNKFVRLWLLLCIWLGATLALPALAAAPPPHGALASVAWLKENLARPDLVVLDASPGQLHRKQHIPGALHADFFSFGTWDMPPAALEKRLRAWGIGPQTQIVIVDEGGTYLAPKLFWGLVHYGISPQRLNILDGGMARWTALAGEVTAQATAAPTAGTVSLPQTDKAVRVRLPEFLAATADPRGNVMLEALDPSYYYGGAAFFDRGGHVPHATMMPADDFFNADKTFKSAQDMQRMLDHLGVKPEQQVHTYCGGGGAAAVPYFALKHLLNYPRVTLFQESQLAWLQDERELPVWTYAAPHLVRDSAWLKGFASPMLKAFGLSRLAVIDIRKSEDFKLGHLPLAVNLPAQEMQAQWQQPRALAALLAQAGVDPKHEAVLVSEGGLNPQSALALLMLESLGQHKVSLYLDNLDRWAELGHEVVRPAAKPAVSPAVTPAVSPAAAPAVAAAYVAQPRAGLWVSDPTVAQGRFPRVFIASGDKPPAKVPAGRVLHLPQSGFVNAGGTPEAAKEIWRVLEKAGVPRYAEIVLFADSVGDAAINYVIFKMMGFGDVKVWAPA